jgi:hypothetical protein
MLKKKQGIKRWITGWNTSVKEEFKIRRWRERRERITYILTVNEDNT